MEIEFVNHASFIINYKSTKLICDPWIEGPAFDKGWMHVSPTKFQYESFSSITHIWFSHEHPDHFAPPNLFKIPEEYRKKITVLFQETTDRKVAEFCKKIGFKETIELKEDQFYTIQDDFKIMCNPYVDGDSYALFKTEETSILNLNDCMVDSNERAKEVAQRTGEVDILFTQFGYAHKIGNLDDTALRKQSSKEKLSRILNQFNFLKPKSIVPFASYVYFCHEENSYMNDGVNDINYVNQFIKEHTTAKSNILYPGDKWDINEDWNSENSIKLYESDFKKVPDNTYIKTVPVAQEELIQTVELFIEKLQNAYNNKSALNSLSTNLYLIDYKLAFNLSTKNKLVQINLDQSDCDIALTSDALNNSLKQLWGIDTLTINARMLYPKNGNEANFNKFGRIAAGLNRGELYRFPTILERIKGKIERLIKIYRL
jgi:L-ascorbate metabolism protein UlaG (beta-lactamase superfamily)